MSSKLKNIKHNLMKLYHYKFKTQLTLNDLNDDCIKCIFNYLTLREKLTIERVCKRFQYLIEEVLKLQNGLLIGYSSYNYNLCKDKSHLIKPSDYIIFKKLYYNLVNNEQ